MNIGLLVGNVKDDFSNAICQGAMEAATAQGANLFVFPGKYLSTTIDDPTQKFEYQYNTLFSYGNCKAIDVLIVAIATIAYDYDAEKRQEFLKQFGDIPIITIASKEDGYASVLYDNATGLLEAMDYLVNVRHKKHFGIVSGPLTNVDAAERYEAVMGFLENAGIAVIKEDIIFSELTFLCEKDAGRLLDHDPGIEAIVCSNDSMAIGVYSAMKKRGLHPGTDISVVGFDDIPYAKNMEPPLATVRADAADLGRSAVNVACEYLKGGELTDTRVDTTFIPRESAEYGLNNLEREVMEFVNRLDSASDMKGAGEKAAEFIIGKHDGVVGTPFYEDLCAFLTLFLRVLFGTTENETAVIELYRLFKALTTKERLRRIDLSLLQSFLQSCYYYIGTDHMEEENVRLTFRLIMHISAKMDEFQSMQLHALRAAQDDHNHILNIISRDVLTASVDYESSYYSTMWNLHMLGIQQSYLYVFPKPIRHLQGEEWVCPDEVLLKAYQHGNESHGVERTKQKMSLNQIFHNAYMLPNQPANFIVLDLFCGDLQYGLMLCELPANQLFYVETFTYLFSSAIQNIRQFLTQREMNRELEVNVEGLKNSNRRLTSIAKLDELTGALNRRGFNSHADAVLKDEMNRSRTLFVMYADMDNLKQINDTYGHDEGDYAICACASVLKLALADRLTYARLGGDEFAAIGVFDEPGHIEEIRRRIDEESARLNAENDKPFIIHLSVGATEIECTEELTLEEALEQADAELYAAKKNKNLSVRK